MLKLTSKANLKPNNLRRLYTATAISNRGIEDEGDWLYSSEWWLTDSPNTRTVFQRASRHGNGIVSVLSHPSSQPDKSNWPRTEKWLGQRCADIFPDTKQDGKFQIGGYEWRTLHFNDFTRESTAKVMAVYREGEPEKLHLMQQAHCLAVPYVKSMISVGLTTIASTNPDLFKNAIQGSQSLNILCIGHGGGSIPLFLARKILGSVIHIVEIDPTVISASTQAMGFPSFSIMTPSGKRLLTKPDPVDEVFWKGTHERLFLFGSDAEKFVLESKGNIYDIIFIDAYDGEDIFPRKLWEPSSPFLLNLVKRLHPKHGTVVLNLHEDAEMDFDVRNSSVLSGDFPLGRHVTQVSRAYKNALLEDEDFGFLYTVSAPWLFNTSLVVCKGFRRPKDGYDWSVALNNLMAKALEVEKLLNLPFSCLQYIKRGFTPVE